MDKNKIEESIIQEAGDIKAGRSCCFSYRDSVRIGANALDEEAAKTYAAKGRPSDNPLIVHIADKEDLKKIAAHIPPETGSIDESFLARTSYDDIQRRVQWSPMEQRGRLDTVAVRMPS